MDDIPQEFVDAVLATKARVPPARVCSLYRRFDGDAAKAVEFLEGKTGAGSGRGKPSMDDIPQEFVDAVLATKARVPPARVCSLYRRFDGDAAKAVEFLEGKKAKRDGMLENIPEEFRKSVAEAYPDVKPMYVVCLNRRFHGDAEAALQHLGSTEEKRSEASDFLDRAAYTGFERQWMLRLYDACGEDGAMEMITKRREILDRKQSADEAVSAAEDRLEAAKAARSAINGELAASRAEFRAAIVEAKEKKKAGDAEDKVREEVPPPPFAAELEMLGNMGFSDRDANLAALIKHDGNIGNAVNTLLQAQ